MPAMENLSELWLIQEYCSHASYGKFNKFQLIQEYVAIENKVNSYLNGPLASLLCLPSPQTHWTQPALMIVLFWYFTLTLVITYTHSKGHNKRGARTREREREHDVAGRPGSEPEQGDSKETKWQWAGAGRRNWLEQARSREFGEALKAEGHQAHRLNLLHRGPPV